VNVAALRRYLQPSPTLRWHPWAPLAAGILMLLLAVYFSAKWGYASAQREEFRGYGSLASAMYMRFLMNEKSPARALLLEAGPLDGARPRDSSPGSRPRSARMEMQI